jgi:cell division transport system permease protein
MSREPRAARRKPPPRAGLIASSAWFRQLKTRFTQHQTAAVDSLLRLFVEPTGTLLAWGVMGIAMALPLCMFLMLANLQHIGETLDRNNTISLYLQHDLNAQELSMLTSSLGERPEVAELTLITAEQALEEFRLNSGFGDVLDGLEENPLPPVLLITPVSAGNAELEGLHAFLSGLPEVDQAQIDLQWLQRFHAMLSVAFRLAVLLGLLLSLGVVLVIGNTVRMAIAERRAEILVVKLVGGTDAYVARPFLYTGLWYGAGGGLVALLFTALGLWALHEPLAQLLASYSGQFAVQGLELTSGFLVVVGASVLGGLGAWLSVLRNLRSIEPR